MGADRITQGTLGTANQDVFDSPGAIIADAVNGLLGVVTNTKAIVLAQSAASVITAQPLLNAITTAQTLLTKLFAAGELNVLGRTVLISGYGIYSAVGGSTPTITIALTLGGVTIATITTGAINTAALTNLQFQFSFQLTVVSVGAAGTVECHGTVSINLSANAPGTAPTVYADTNTGVSAAINLTTADTALVTIAASSTLTSAQLRLGSVEILA